MSVLLIIAVLVAGWFIYQQSAKGGGSSDWTVASVAQTAGFQGIDLTTAVAIALAESGGQPGVYNPETAAKGGTPTGMGSYGLWQIYLRDHPQFDAQSLYDPQYNANAAFSLYTAAGQSFQDWVGSYGNGRYFNFMSQAQDQVAALSTACVSSCTTA